MTVYVDDMLRPARIGRLTSRWELANPRPLAEPIPCKGRLGLANPTGA